jgi:hypothetical protein
MKPTYTYLPHFHSLAEILKSPEFEGLPIIIYDGPEKQNGLVAGPKEAGRPGFKAFHDFESGGCHPRNRS